MVFVVFAGACQEVTLIDTVPANGTTFTMFANNATNVSLFCELMVDGSEHITEWSLLTMENKEAQNGPSLLLLDDARFIISGDSLGGVIGSNRNLTLVDITPELHNSTIFCGAIGQVVADFIFLIYGMSKNALLVS